MSNLYDIKTKQFTDHFAGYNDQPMERSKEADNDEKEKEHITVVTL